MQQPVLAVAMDGSLVFCVAVLLPAHGIRFVYAPPPRAFRPQEAAAVAALLSGDGVVVTSHGGAAALSKIGLILETAGDTRGAALCRRLASDGADIMASSGRQLADILADGPGPRFQWPNGGAIQPASAVDWMLSSDRVITGLVITAACVAYLANSCGAGGHLARIDTEAEGRRRRGFYTGWAAGAPPVLISGSQQATHSHPSRAPPIAGSQQATQAAHNQP